MSNLRNGSFEGITRPGGWTRQTHSGVEYGEVYCPEGWTAWWKEGAFRRPEMKVIQNIPPFTDPPRIHEGDWAFQAFTMYGRQHAGLYQVVAGLLPGETYELAAWAHAWSLHPGIGEQSPYCSSGVGCGAIYIPEGDAPALNGDPENDGVGNFVFRVGVSYGDPDPEAVGWGDGAHIYNVYHEVPPLRFIAPDDGKVTIYLCATSIWEYKNSDACWDCVTLKKVSTHSPPKDRGQPRVQYERTYILLPQNCGKEWALAAVEGGHAERRTVGYSADDAGIGALDVRNIIAVNSSEWPGDLELFFKQYYPGINYTAVVAATPDELREKLSGPFDPGPPDTPPPVPPPPIPPRVTRGHLGLHLQTMVEGWRGFVLRMLRSNDAHVLRREAGGFMTTVHPAVCKVLASMEDVKGLARACPDTIRVWRHVENNLGGIFPNPDPHEGARRWIRMFLPSLDKLCNEMARDFPHLPEPYVYVEPWNEIYNSDYEIVRQAAAHDMAFLIEMAALGLPVRAVAFTAAVGNPHHLGGQYELLVPLARVCEELGGMFGYHAYWLANPEYGGPDHLWKYLAGRWTEIDDVLRAHGVRVRWFFGEMGAVGGTSGHHPDGTGWVNLNAGSGWKDSECYAGDWPRYLGDLMRWDELIAEWNTTHEDRAVGGTIFTSGADYCGWRSFQVREPEMRDMATVLLERYPM